MPIAISGSVGEGGVNTPADVVAVQTRLKELGFTWIPDDGIVTAKVVSTIRLFQAIKNGDQKVDVAHNDGKVDPGGDTLAWLNASNAPKWMMLPAGSAAEGYVNIEVADTADDHDFGTNWLSETIKAAGQTYRAGYLSANPGAAIITVNDASLPEGGNTPDHKGHESGLSCDMRLPCKDGTSPPGTTYTSAQYDRAAARAIIESFRSQELFDRCFFNDTVLIDEGLCASEDGHDNHIHIQIGSPPRE